MKPITIDDTQKETLIADFIKYVTDLKSNAEKITYTVTMGKVLEKNIKKPLVYFTKKASEKMAYLVQNYNKEIAWHGVVTKKDDAYTVEDILVYPQTVTSATVETDDEEYAKWMNSIDNNTFPKLRLQGHSHVNFTATPSGTDTNYYNKLLNNLSKDDYYIFFIMNKSNKYWINIYDYAQNVIFETADINIQFEAVPDPYAAWYEKSLKMITEHKCENQWAFREKEKTKTKTKNDDDYSQRDYMEEWREKYGYNRY